MLRAVAKHSPELSQNVVAAGALDPLVSCLSEFEPSVKEAAVWALSHIARHNSELAQGVVDAGAIAQLVLCLQEPELALRRISASALSELAKHSPEVHMAKKTKLSCPLSPPQPPPAGLVFSLFQFVCPVGC